MTKNITRTKTYRIFYLVVAAVIFTQFVFAQHGEMELKTNPAANVTTKRIADAPQAEPQNWLTYGGGYDNQRYSRLAEINTKNVSGLKPVWLKQFGIPHGFETTPIVVDDVMYITTGGNTSVYALDAKTGKEYWHFAGAVPEDVAACCDWVNRGVAIADGKVFFVTLDAQFYALDAKSGKMLWKQTVGDTRDGITATVAPLVVKDKVIVGMSGGEYGVRGYLDAYDIKTGKRMWRFWTIPAPGEPHHDSWGGKETWRTGGGTTWVTGAYDPQLDTLYWTTGNPGPDFNGEVRPGDNLYTDSLLALDPDTGKLKWHFQFTPHDVWDYDGVSEVILTDLDINGRNSKVLLHADKNGYYYVIDRTNGKFLFAKPFARATWVKSIDPRTGRPEVNKDAVPGPTFKMVCPGPAGAKEWVHMAFSPQTKMVYIPVIENCAEFRVGQAFYSRGLPFWGSAANIAAGGPEESHGFLKAVNAATGEEMWKIRSEDPVVSGVLATAGNLVFWGEADGMFHATDARTGKDVWTYNVGSGIHAPPVTFALGGKQYVAIAAGWGGWVEGFAPELMEKPRSHTLVVFALP